MSPGSGVDIQNLIEALDERADELAVRAQEIFVRIVPEAKNWSDAKKDAFANQARSRIAAVLAVTEHGAEVDEALRRDLQEVGAEAARANASLNHLMMGLRITRDVLLQAAMRLTEEDAAKWKSVLLTFSQKMLPSIDRLTDSISTGYWNGKVDKLQEELHRFESLVEGIPYGIYEVDMDGLITFANPAMTNLVGRSHESVVGYPLNEVLKPVDGSLSTLLSETPDGVSQASIVAKGVDGGHVTFDIDTVVRRKDDIVVGFAGLVRQAGPIGVTVDLTPLVRHIFELRRSIEILTDAGEFINRKASLMSVDQITEAGESVSKQAQRLMVIVDELDADRRSIQPPQG